MRERENSAPVNAEPSDRDGNAGHENAGLCGKCETQQEAQLSPRDRAMRRVS